MSIPHYIASGMGGIRTTGDLVARMELSRNMRIDDAKKYVAKRLEMDVFDICDEEIMRERRMKEQIGVVDGAPNAAFGMTAKMNIEKLLDIKINSCEHVRQMLKF